MYRNFHWIQRIFIAVCFAFAFVGLTESISYNTYSPDKYQIEDMYNSDAKYMEVKLNGRDGNKLLYWSDIEEDLQPLIVLNESCMGITTGAKVPEMVLDRITPDYLTLVSGKFPSVWNDNSVKKGICNL
jgi:hypothetical protein